MLDLEGLLAYLSSGPCIAWIGNGPSIEMGLKSWNTLARSILEDARKARKSGFHKLEEYYATKKYPQFFGEIERQYGKEYLLNQTRLLLKDTKSEGELYKAIAKLPFRAFFTTNFDDLLYRHLTKNKAWNVYQNDKENLCSIEIDVIPSIVKLHGSLDEGLEDTLILTDDQYRLWYEQGEKLYFRQFLEGHLSTQRIVFIGYSLSDPELMYIQKRLAANLRRKTPAIAILANVSDSDLDLWARDYNISVLRYMARGDDHSELTNILNTAARFMSDSPKASPVRAEESRLAQKFYFWHRFERSDETQTQVDALKSVVLSTANEMGAKPFTCEALADVLKETLKISSKKLSENIVKSCAELSEEGWLIANSGSFTLTTHTKELIDNYNHQYEDLIRTFLKQVEVDISAKTSGLSDEQLSHAAETVLETLTEIFKIRGIEIFNMAFANTPVSIAGANDVLSTIWNRATQINDPKLVFLVTNYIIDLLTRPQGVSKQVVEYLSRAFFAMQAIRMHAGDAELVNEFYKNQAFLIDENVLIPLIAIEEPRHELCVKALSAAVEKGIFVFTTEYAVQEVMRHGEWASNLISMYGEQSAQVLRASRGEGEYTSNAFLNGYIRESANEPSPLDFDNYISKCVGDQFSYGQIWNKLNSLGVIRLNRDKIRNLKPEIEKLHKDIQYFIAYQAAERQVEKSPERIERESDAYVIIYYWSEFSKLFNQGHRSQCSFLTFATALAGVALKGPKPIHRSILASPEALYELIIRYMDHKEEEMDISSVMRSSYFRTAGQFLDNDKYADFFAPLISEFRRTFREHFALYKQYIEEKLSKGVINEYEPLDMVDFVSSLEGKLEATPRNLISENEQVRKELTIANKRIVELENRERKRKEYIRRQKNESKKRKN